MTPHTTPEATTYPLPSSPTLKVLDRFSILPDSASASDTSGLIPLWPLLHALLAPTTTPSHDRTKIITTFPALTALLDTIAVTLRGTAHPAGDYALLREAILSHFGSEARFFAEVWPRLVEVGLQMPVLFPGGALPVLGCGAEEVVLTRRQVGCLVVHMFWRSVVAPWWKEGGAGEGEGQGDLCDFGVWYGSQGQRQVGAVRVYLRALMGYFEEVVCPLAVGGVGEDGEWMVGYALRSVEEREVEVLLLAGCALGQVEVEVVERFDTAPRSLGIPGGAAVVAANKYIGFGQSATQEEVHVGSSPEACPAVLITPPLRDDQVLIVRGAQATINVTGQRRDIKAEEMPMPGTGTVEWRDRTMLFMDALELDVVEPGDSLPDLVPANLRREVRKAYTAFSSCRFREIRTGLWGCGAFCGDPGTKMLLLWLAASLADTKLVVVCDEAGREFAEEFQCVAKKAQAVVRDTADLWQLLSEAPTSLVRGKTLRWIFEQLEKR